MALKNQWVVLEFKYYETIALGTLNILYLKPKNSQYTNSPTEWMLINLDFTEVIYGIKIILDQYDTTHSDMCFSNITITQSVY